MTVIVSNYSVHCLYVWLYNVIYIQCVTTYLHGYDTISMDMTYPLYLLPEYTHSINMHTHTCVPIYVHARNLSLTVLIVLMCVCIIYMYCTQWSGSDCGMLWLAYHLWCVGCWLCISHLLIDDYNLFAVVYVVHICIGSILHPEWLVLC